MFVFVRCNRDWRPLIRDRRQNHGVFTKDCSFNPLEAMKINIKEY